ncbi:MAG: glycosyltransferase, partial [Xanthomonadales bacterium]|nr:glycosyltransferase [Xanthomonadales bacterium]
MPRRTRQADDPRASMNAAVFVHAEGRAAIDTDWLQTVADLGHPLYSHRELPGVHRTQHGLDRPGALFEELAQARPGAHWLILRHGLAPNAATLAPLRDAAELDTPRVLTAASNGDSALNPFAGLANAPEGDEAARLVAWLAPGQAHRLRHWPAHLAWLNPAALDALRGHDDTRARLVARLEAAGGEVQALDRAFVPDRLARPGAAAHLESHERPRPPVLAALAARARDWCEADAGAPDHRPGERPVTLHVSHSWGGGIEQWIRSFCAARPEVTHLLLRSEAPRSGQEHGQRLALYLASELDHEPAAPLARWWLEPAIRDCDEHHPGHAQVMAHVTSRYGVSRVMVSSLVGHSLDALRTGLPTVQVLHDAFPAWPLLSVNPAPWLRDGKPADLQGALDAHAGRMEFPGRDAASWRSLAEAHRQALIEHDVRLAAPGPAVEELVRALHPDHALPDIRLIPHGLPALDNEQGPVAPRARADGRLRLVVPGRIQAGKGQALLREALPRLAPHAHVTLLGTGQSGHEFFGLPGVDVVPEYRREDLPRLLHRLGPHAGLLLSLVPETWSYTLSELRALGIPPVATRVGSLARRIEHDHDGRLIEPDADALVSEVEALASDPSVLDAIRERLTGHRERGVAEMADDYDALCPPGDARAPAQGSDGPRQDGPLAWQAATEAAAVDAARKEVLGLQREVERRTEWALNTDRALRDEQRRRERWVARLEAEISDLSHQRDHARDQAAQLEHERDQLLGSLSWRITRPLRVARRLAGSARRARAYNPLRWPLLGAQLVRNLTTLGWRDTLMRLQSSAGAPAPEEAESPALDPVGDPRPPARLPAPDEPVASIVVPVHGKWPYTAACLRSLADAECEVPFEVIVVDDCSPDETPERLAGIRGLRTIRNEQNLGFIGACNRGAEAAKGRYLVLLNNDTQVTDGWLDHLLDTFERHPDAGLVGAKLVYPDGRLQECGGIVFRDGSAWNYGRGDRASLPPYQCVREVDYCSGACIAIERERFLSLGGFDTRYAPAYYEDTDLAFRVREAGLKVYVQPRAKVVHHEGISSGTDTRSGTKRYQAVNAGKFLERWSKTLNGHPAPITDPENAARVRAARDHRLAGRVLVIDAHTPEPDQDSGSVRLTGLMRCFRDLGFGVTFFADNRGHAGRYTDALQAMGVECWYAPHLERIGDFFATHGGDFDLVLISRHYVAVHYLALIKRHCPGAKFVFDTVDLHYLRERRMAELEDSLPLKRAAEQTRRSELAVIRAADLTLVVSEAECEVLAEDAPGAEVHVLSNIHEVHGRRAGFGERQDLFFVGGYQHPPNVDAAGWFVGEIWPRVREQLPGVSFHLVGSKAPERVRALGDADGVTFHGFVEDLAPFLDGCRLAVAPLRYGAGV